MIFFIFAAWFLILHFDYNKKDKLGGVAYVSYSKELQESSILAQENVRNEAVNALANAAENRTLEKYYAMPEPIRREIRFIEKGRNINKLRAEQGRIRRISQQVIKDEIEKYRIDNHYSVVFNKDLASPSHADKDISDEIIVKVRNIKVDYGVLPKFDEEALAQYE